MKIKTEHTGAKRTKGFWGKKREAKETCKRVRRKNDKEVIRNEREIMELREGLNVLSLFDGISCGRIALERAGIKINKYFASEVDKYAIKVSKSNYPDIEHIGDIKDIKGTTLPKIDLLIGGSPCQDLSGLKKGAGLQGEKSKLFFDFV
ncbi:MAG: DNA cytosine methyltransferase, partial [Fidelibacterota bacterium]